MLCIAGTIHHQNNLASRYFGNNLKKEVYGRF